MAEERGLGRGAAWYSALVAWFAASLTASQFLAAKVASVEVLGYRVAFPAAVLAYALTFTATDVIDEVWGRRAAGYAVLVGFTTQLLVLGYAAFALRLPYAPFSPAGPGEYEAVVGAGANIIVASLAAYALSQTHDVWAFWAWKRLTGGRWLWLRNNASTLVSQLIDTAVFITLAFTVIPSLTGGEALPLSVAGQVVLGQYLVKALIALADTPIVYGLVALVESSLEAPTPTREAPTGALPASQGLEA
jgi:uncharacterized integral membrane protein (TIGR00697 family)